MNTTHEIRGAFHLSQLPIAVVTKAYDISAVHEGTCMVAPGGDCSRGVSVTKIYSSEVITKLVGLVATRFSVALSKLPSIILAEALLQRKTNGEYATTDGITSHIEIELPRLEFAQRDVSYRNLESQSESRVSRWLDTLDAQYLALPDLHGWSLKLPHCFVTLPDLNNVYCSPVNKFPKVHV